MEISFRQLSQRLPKLFNALLIIVVIALISLLAPSQLRFKYAFERGQIWRYEDLRAPFDFPLLKTEDELAAERNELIKNISPAYAIYPQVGRAQIDTFAQEFGKLLDGVKQEQTPTFPDVVRRSEAYLNFGRNYLRKLYDRGILSLSAAHSGQSKEFVISVIRGTVMREQTLGSLLTEQKAKDLLSDSLPYIGLAEPEFLFPLLEDRIQPNLFYEDSLTQRMQATALSELTTHKGLVKRGELLVAKGAVVNDEIYQKLISYKQQQRQDSDLWQSYGVSAGYTLLIGSLVLLFSIYLQTFAKLVYNRYNRLIFILMWPVLYSYLVYLVEQVDTLSVYMIPYCIAPIVIKTFFTERLALFTHLITVLITGFLTSVGYNFIFLQMVAGVVVLLARVDTRNWSRFFYSMLFIFLSYMFGLAGLSLVEGGDLSALSWPNITAMAMNVFLTLSAYPLIPLLERLFGFVSPITLVELTDMNQPLLRELALRAPGTLQHSLQVAHLAEAAARRIGADELLVRVGALYHDIGKKINPGYFIENQGEKNLHEDKSDLESARIVIGHVFEGIQMAKRSGLPGIIIDFIRTHHGTTRAEYFYRNYVNAHPDETVDESLFRYPGPRPRSKEETILMLADSLEAASRSLKNPSAQELSDLIDKIVAGKVNLRQLEDSQLSFRELEECKGVFRQLLRSIHHVRIEYPKENT
jgi:hypothetical protein